MPMFALNCIDKPDSLALRLATRPEHLAYMATRPEIRLGGPYLNAAGEPVGSLIIVEMEDEAAVQAFTAADPYNLAGLFASVEIRGWRYSAGKLP